MGNLPAGRQVGNRQICGRVQLICYILFVETNGDAIAIVNCDFRN